MGLCQRKIIPLCPIIHTQPLRHFVAPMPILLRLQSDLDSCKFRLQAHISSLGLSCLVRTRSSCPQRVLLSCKYAVKRPCVCIDRLHTPSNTHPRTVAVL